MAETDAERLYENCTGSRTLWGAEGRGSFRGLLEHGSSSLALLKLGAMCEIPGNPPVPWPGLAAVALLKGIISGVEGDVCLPGAAWGTRLRLLPIWSIENLLSPG